MVPVHPGEGVRGGKQWFSTHRISNIMACLLPSSLSVFLTPYNACSKRLPPEENNDSSQSKSMCLAYMNMFSSHNDPRS